MAESQMCLMLCYCSLSPSLPTSLSCSLSFVLSFFFLSFFFIYFSLSLSVSLSLPFPPRNLKPIPNMITSTVLGLILMLLNGPSMDSRTLAGDPNDANLHATSPHPSATLLLSFLMSYSYLSLLSLSKTVYVSDFRAT